MPISSCCRGVLAAIFALACLAPPMPALADEVTLADRTIQLTPSNDFCALDRRDAREDLIFATFEKMIGPENRLLAYWVRCLVLERYRSGQTDQLVPYVMVMAQLQGGNIVPVDAPRAEFLAALDEYLAQSHGGQDVVTESGDEIRRRFDDTVGRLGDAQHIDLDVGDMRVLGLLASEDIARYVGVMLSISRDGKATPIAGVLGLTEVKGLSLTVNAYDIYADQRSFDRLQALTHGFIDGLLTDNDDRS
jgi:hypothetical protein